MRWTGLLISCTRRGKSKVSNKRLLRILIHVSIDPTFLNLMNGVFKILSDNRENVKNNFCEIIISTDLIVLHRSSVDESSDGLLEFPF